MIRTFKNILTAALIVCSYQQASAQDFTRLGGDTTTTIPGRNALQVFTPNISSEERREVQLSGFAPFHKRFKKSEGLGPLFINSSCAGCHVQNGRGNVRLTDNPRRQNGMVIKVSLPGLEQDGRPRDIPGIGEQLQDRTTRGKSKFRTKLFWRRVKGEYPDGSRYTLMKPRLRFRIPGYRRRDVVSSLRMAPGLVGMGLLEAIPEATVLAFSDPFDANGDGISGTPNYVPNVVTGELNLGRFGFRASHPTVEQQTAIAAALDMGLTNSLFPGNETVPDVTDDGLMRLSLYQALGGVPIARNQNDPFVLQGKALFQSVGCDDCHKFNITTSDPLNPELDNQTIHPFTDLLLHDMGPGLADGRAEYAAAGSEWRTTPLWGIGFLDTVSRVRQRYLHDGRARSVEEAILWHGGEAQKARDNFTNLTKEQRNALLAFLDSI